MFRALSNYADFSGRASRSEYWLFYLLNVIVIGIAGAFMLSGITKITGIGDLRQHVHNTSFATGLFVAVVWVVFALIPNVAVTVRRLHDRDMSGWWYLGFIALGMLPFVGWLFSIAFLVVLCLRGTDGDNRFGPDPLDDGWSTAEVFS